MPRYAHAAVDVPEWVETSPVRPCPVCGGTSQCSIHEDGEFARCLEVICDWPVLTGGWLHRIGDLGVDTISQRGVDTISRN
jgi:hypothetical protein